MHHEKGQTGPVGSMAGSALERIRALQAKAAMKQAVVDACQGHIWRADYVSQIVASPPAGGSSVCVRCGERRAWKDIGPDEPTEFQSLPNDKAQP